MRRILQLRSDVSLGLQMLIIFSVGLLMLTSIQIISLDYKIRNDALSQAGEIDIKQAKFFASLIDSDIAETMSNIKAHASTMHSIGLTSNVKLVERQLDGMQRVQSKFAWIGYADIDGKIQAATQGMLVGKSVTARPWFIQGRDKHVTVDVHDAVMLTFDRCVSKPTHANSVVACLHGMGLQLTSQTWSQLNCPPQLPTKLNLDS